MAIFLCPQCRYKQLAQDKDLGKIAKCPKCEGRAEVLSRDPDQVFEPVSSLQTPADDRFATEAPSAESTDSTVAVRPFPQPAKADIKALIFTGSFIVALLTFSIGLELLSMTDVARQKVSVEFHPTEWEYAIKSPSDSSFTTDMNNWGKLGWELVTARRATGGYDVSYEVILKRPVKSK